MEPEGSTDQADSTDEQLPAVSSANSRARRDMPVVTVAAVADSTEVESPPPKRVRVQPEASDSDHEDREADSDASNSVYHDFVNSDENVFDVGSTSPANAPDDGTTGGNVEVEADAGGADDDDDSNPEYEDDEDNDDGADAFLADEYDDSAEDEIDEPDGNDPDAADPDDGEAEANIPESSNDAAPDDTAAAAADSADLDAEPAANTDNYSNSPMTAEPETEDIEAPTGNLRLFKRIPIFIVDYHIDVLEFLYRCLASRHLPLENNILVHFDSHPDMVISREIPASAVTDKETMLSELSIENWIMPTCYAGHFNRVVWLKNSWCTQIDVGKYNFKVGEKDDLINVDCPLDYFISEGTYCATGDLSNARPVELQVYNADTDELDPLQFLSSVDAPNFVLDIDLDFFSTSNPFLEIYENANCYAQLTEIFRYESNPKDYVATTERRKLQLEALRSIFDHLETERDFTNLAPPDPAHVPDETLARIHNLAKALAKHYRDNEIDWLLIFDSGCTTDNGGLPHHNSTPEQLIEYFGYFERFLERLPIPPIAITIACSTEDDYCPKHQVAYIQDEVLRMLREKFGDQLHEKPILHYKDDVWDIMKL